MVNLRGLVLCALVLPVAARRSIRIGISRYDTSQQTKTLTEAFAVSADAREAVFPRGSGVALFHRWLPQPDASRAPHGRGLFERKCRRAKQLELVRTRDGQRSATVALQTATGPGSPQPATGPRSPMQLALREAMSSPVQMATLLRQLCEEDRPLTGENVATILYSCAKIPALLDSSVLQYLASHLQHPSLYFSRFQTAHALYGLQHLRDSPDVRRLIAALTPKVEGCRKPLRSQGVGMALYGLQSVGGSSETCSLLAALTPKVRDCPEQLDVQAAGMALYGLRSMRDSPEVRAMVAVLTPMVRGADVFDAWAVSSLYGLQRLVDSPEVRELLHVLAFKIEQCADEFDANLLGRAFYGLRLQEDNPAVRGVVAALTPKVQACSDRFTARNVGSTFIGLRQLGDTAEVRGAIAALTPKVQHSQRLNARAVASTLSGLQSLGASPEVCGLLAVLAPRIEQCEEPLSAAGVGMALSGLASVGECPEFGFLIAALTPLVTRCTEPLSDRDFSTALEGLRSVGFSPEVRALTEVLLTKSVGPGRRNGGLS